MENTQELLTEFGKRIQRCYGCFIAYHLKDMYLGEDVTFFCEHCKDETMFHFNEFAALMDHSKLKEASDEHHPCPVERNAAHRRAGRQPDRQCRRRALDRPNGPRPPRH